MAFPFSVGELENWNIRMAFLFLQALNKPVRAYYIMGSHGYREVWGNSYLGSVISFSSCISLNTIDCISDLTCTLSSKALNKHACQYFRVRYQYNVSASIPNFLPKMEFFNEPCRPETADTIRFDTDTINICFSS